VSTVAVIVLIVVALLLIAMLAAALRRSATRTAHHGPSDDPSFRSHAEASRGDRRQP
jgi:archaellum component FlaG (FlaF/FlaG flagellin family)